MEKLIGLGLAFADDTPADQMKKERDEGTPSKHRDMSPEQVLKIFKDMQAGSKEAEGYCIRGKIDHTHKVKCLRDPVFYRSKPGAWHVRTGAKYQAYPTYDFACAIVDSMEGVTHCLRTIEYHDRNDMYWWLQKKLGLQLCEIYDYSKLNMVSTVLSKRKLKWFVEQKLVDGWYDPRFPTV